jgi:hypothetical protein
MRALPTPLPRPQLPPQEILLWMSSCTFVRVLRAFDICIYGYFFTLLAAILEYTANACQLVYASYKCMYTKRPAYAGLLVYTVD